MNEENLHWEKGEKWKMTSQNSKHKPTIESKTKTKGAVKDPTKTIHNYFPVVPKVNEGKGEDSGVIPKDEARVTEHTTPDKCKTENVKCQANGNSKGKIHTSNRCLSISTYFIDICLCLHCWYPRFGAKPINKSYIVTLPQKAKVQSEQSKSFEEKIKKEREKK